MATKKYKNRKSAIDIVSKALARKVDELDWCRSLIEKAFVAGRSQTTWKQFKKDNNII